MKVILTENVVRVGKKGELINVKTGYFRNYLLPNNLAVVADKENMAKFEAMQAQLKAEEEKNRAEAEKTKSKIEENSVSIKVKAGEEGKLFGSVTNKDIAEALLEKGIEVDKKKISLEEDIVKTGQYKANIRLFPEVIAELKVLVEAE
ncbi:MAG: 50S ribosomal protein L9 [Peptoniphilaceae bacterium]|nr:50S ribosomal protein L9 [Peptoniphilaceae bacterium]MDY6018197.1 50S ribosomal protein L9 [Anaerococcus sp.]